VGGPADSAGVAGVRAFCQRLARFASALVQSRLVDADAERPMVVSAGGSVFFDDVASILTEALSEPIPTEVVLRSGCYVTHDHGMYARLTPRARGGDGPALQPALEVWGRVLSTPEPGRAMVDVGRRDVSYDAGLPQALWRKAATGGPSQDLEATVTALNDQHAFLELPAGAELRVGDWVGFGVSHPCTTFDKWNVLMLADAEDRLLELLATRF
jgi:D-serine deaminase-like pyridoxal phosphate-dependent protein